MSSSLLIALLACTEDPCADTPVGELGRASPATDPFAAYDPRTCIPDETAYGDVAAPILEASCNQCHGDPTAFGAPLSLTDYDAMLEGGFGDRPVDRIARRAAALTMPPPSSPPLGHEELDSLVAWSTCGEVHPDPSIAVEVNAPVYDAVVPENLELPSFDVSATGYELDRTTLDDYQCFAIDVPVDDDRFIERMQVVVDDSRVLHHVVLALDPQRVTEGQDQFECSDFPYVETPYLYAWAPGTDAFDFEDGGLRVSPGDRIVVQIHYNNGAGIDRVVDSSGVRVFHGPPTGREWFMEETGPEGFVVPEGDSAVCEQLDLARDWTMLAGMPHMHRLGAEMHQVLERADGLFEPVFDLVGWNFESQRFYRYDLEMRKGDKLHTWCVYENETGAPAHFGEKTENEMCYHFAYVSAPE